METRIEVMSVVYILIGFSLPMALGFLIAFIKNAKTGQFDDVETPAMRILHDDTIQENPTEKQAS